MELQIHSTSNNKSIKSDLAYLLNEFIFKENPMNLLFLYIISQRIHTADSEDMFVDIF